MKITFYGAAENVTGSKHLIEVGDYKLLLDCGLHQGRRREAEQMNRNLPFDAKTINAVILSHAHADHCGALPVLIKDGFAGNIYSTKATADIARLIMLDSAKIQAEDARYLNKHLPPNSEEVKPLYTEAMVNETVERFVSVPYFRVSKEWYSLNENIRFKLYDAGHILGSSVIVVQINENGETKTVAFTGDLGNINVPLMRSPEAIVEPVDALLMECTYGDKNHRPTQDADDELAKVIKQAILNKGKIIIPAFSLGRTQELIYALHKLFDENKVPQIPVYVDSPLSVNILEVFRRHTEDFDAETWQDFGSKGDKPFIFENLTYIHSAEESKELNKKAGPFIVISASGMAEGGRIRHHLLNNISDPNNFIVLTGYQAVNTLGRKIEYGVSPVNILGESRDVNAKVLAIKEFSAHADQNGLLNYLSKTNNLKHLYLVHTESPQDEIFKTLVRAKYPQLDVEIPSQGMTVEI